VGLEALESRFTRVCVDKHTCADEREKFAEKIASAGRDGARLNQPDTWWAEGGPRQVDTQNTVVARAAQAVRQGNLAGSLLRKRE